jgi:solute carrier family 25 citrate transporter 1
MSKPSTTISIAAGAAAGGCETLVTVCLCQMLLSIGCTGQTNVQSQYPVEYIKTRRQLPAAKSLSSMTIVRETLASSGVKGLYSGCGALAVSNMAKSGIRFLSFETARSNLPTMFPSLKSSPLLNAYSGLCAGIAESVLVVTPGEAVKTRIVNAAAMAQTKAAQLSTPQLVSRMLHKEGIFSFWRGLAPVVCKQGTNSAVRFSTFGALGDLFRKSDTIRANASPSVVTFAAGAGSGVITVYASMPFDNIKTRVQTQSAGGTGMLACAREMLVREGIASFWKATTPRLVRLTLSSSITFTVYDFVVQASRRST